MSSENKHPDMRNYYPYGYMEPQYSKGYVLRMCASELSVPNEAEKVSTVWDTNKHSDINRFTGFEYGFSYLIRKTEDKCEKYRIFEEDIMFGTERHEYCTSLFDLVTTYHDEDFREAGLLLPSDYNCEYIWSWEDPPLEEDHEQSEVYGFVPQDNGNEDDGEGGWTTV